MKITSWVTRTCVMSFVLIVSASNPSNTQAAVGALDGRAFIADAGERGKAADEKGDVITFADGVFHSSLCDKWGYGKGDYKVTGSAEAINFEAETVSAKDGRLKWKGTIKGDTIEGSFIHYRKPSILRANPEPVEHWFKGKSKV